MTIYSGETARFALSLEAEDTKPQSPLPGTVSVEVRSSDEATIKQAALAMNLVVLDTGTATSGSTTTIVDTAQAWLTDQWRDACVRITSGAGVGQERRVKSNTATTLTLETKQVVDEAIVGPLAVAAAAGSVYQLHKASYRKNWDCPTSLLEVDLIAVFVAQTIGGSNPYKAAEKLEFRVEGEAV